MPDPELEKTVARLEKRFDNLQHVCDRQLPLGGKERWESCAKEHTVISQAAKPTPDDFLVAGRLSELRTKLAAMKTRYADFEWPVAPDLRKKLQGEYMALMNKNKKSGTGTR